MPLDMGFGRLRVVAIAGEVLWCLATLTATLRMASRSLSLTKLMQIFTMLVVNIKLINSARWDPMQLSPGTMGNPVLVMLKVNFARLLEGKCQLRILRNKAIRSQIRTLKLLPFTSTTMETMEALHLKSFATCIRVVSGL